MSPQRKSERSKLRMEALEQRQMLSVTANLIDGDLVIQGDAAVDVDQIVVSEFNGLFGVVALPGTALLTTTPGAVAIPPAALSIPGSSGFAFPGVVDNDVLIDLDGNDQVGVVDMASIDGGVLINPVLADPVFNVPEDLEISGAQAIGIANAAVADDVEILGTALGDVVAIQNLAVADSLFAELGAGNDTLGIAPTAISALLLPPFPASLVGAVVGGETEIDTGDGNDAVGIWASTFQDHVGVELEDGGDLVALVGNAFNDGAEIDGGDGVDALGPVFGNIGDIEFDDIP